MPATRLSVNETFKDAAIRVCQNYYQPCDLVGFLRVEDSPTQNVKRLRIVFQAYPKELSNVDTDGVHWVTLNEMNELYVQGRKFRTEEPLRWAHHIAKGGKFVPIEHLAHEDAPMPFNVGDFQCELTDTFKEKGLRGPSIGYVGQEEATRIVSEKDHGKLKMLLANNRIDVNMKLERDLTLLMCAVMQDSVEMVKFLLLADADPFWLTDKRRNAVHQAAQASSNVLRKVLLATDHTAANQQDVNGDTPLHCAVSTFLKSADSNTANIQILLAYGVNGDICNKNGISPNSYIHTYQITF